MNDLFASKCANLCQMVAIGSFYHDLKECWTISDLYWDLSGPEVSEKKCSECYCFHSWAPVLHFVLIDRFFARHPEMMQFDFYLGNFALLHSEKLHFHHLCNELDLFLAH